VIPISLFFTLRQLRTMQRNSVPLGNNVTSNTTDDTPDAHELTYQRLCDDVSVGIPKNPTAYEAYSRSRWLARGPPKIPVKEEPGTEKTKKAKKKKKTTPSPPVANPTLNELMARLQQMDEENNRLRTAVEERNTQALAQLSLNNNNPVTSPRLVTLIHNPG
jgi:hypothetical protein